VLEWLLLLHQIPPKPGYFRAKVMRRLNALGALAIKNSAYLLPANEQTLEDFHWLVREIREQGGDAWLFRASALAGHTDESLSAEFRALRAADWDALAHDARALLGAGVESADEHEPERQRLRQRFGELERIDFFRSPAREAVEVLMSELERSLPPRAGRAPAIEDDALAELRGRTWVTRAGVKVDRIASAWLVRRFIDPAALFGFVDPQRYTPGPRDVRFDMFEGEFTHVGDRCTFEVLLERSGAADSGLRALAEIIHDIDLKDAKFARPEAAGLALVIDGIVLGSADDAKRLEEGARVLDALYARLAEVR